MLSFLSAVIIDTFAALRGNADDIKEDQDGICFICGLDREVFERNKIEFIDHVNLHHYMWNYVYYIAYLKEKDKTEFSGLETKVWEKYDSRSLDFFPQHVALYLMKHNKIERSYVNKKLGKIKDKLENIEFNVDKTKGITDLLE